MVSRITLIFGMILSATIPTLCQSAQQGDTQNSSKSLLDVKHTQNTNTIPMYEVFELTFKHEKKYTNPFFDVTIEVIFTSPSKRAFPSRRIPLRSFIRGENPHAKEPERERRAAASNLSL